MGKPLIHMIPSQEANLRKTTTHSKVTPDSEALQPNQALATIKKVKNGVSSELSGSNGWVEGNGVMRSRTNATNESGKSSNSNETGLSSFSHSNASFSTSPSADSINHTSNRIKTTKALVPESITTSAENTVASSTPVSISSKLRIAAVQNLDESIEITRQSSSNLERPSVDTGEFLGVSQPSMSETNKSSKNDKKKAKLSAKGSTKGVSLGGTALKPKGRSVDSTGSIKIRYGMEENFTTNCLKQEAYKFGDESTISSKSSYRTSSFDSSKRYSLQEDHSGIQQFEVLLDDVSQAQVEVEKAPTTKRLKAKNTKSTKQVSDSAVNPRVFVTRPNKKGSPTRSSRQRQRSIPSSSNSFFSAMDNHIATRGSNKARSRRKQESVMTKDSPSRVKNDAVRVTDDITKAPAGTNHALLSPSKIKAGRQSPTFQSHQQPAKKKKVYSISQGKLVVQEVEESIEVKDTGSVIMGQQQDEEHLFLNTESTLEVVKEQVKESNADEVHKTSCSKTPTRSLIAKGFRWKNQQLESPPPLVTHPRNAFPPNSIKVVSDEENPSAVELLREKSDLVSGNMFSSDEEDSIIKEIPQVESLTIVREDNDIEIVATSSSCATSAPLHKGDSVEKIICIRKLESQDSFVESSPSAVQIKVISQDQNSAPEETSAPPKKFEPVVETPSNRVEGNVAELERAGSYAGSYTTQSASSIPSISRTDPSSNTPIGHVTPKQPKMDMTVKVEADAPQNGDQLIFVGKEKKIAKGVFIPKLPAPKKDSSCKSHVFSRRTAKKTNESADTPEADGPTSEERSREVNILSQSVKKPDGDVNNIEVTSMASSYSPGPTTSESKISSTAMKMIVKKPSPAQASIQQIESFGSAVFFEPKHIVRVNVLGIAGIVVDRTKCRDVTGNLISPSPPEQMTAVVGISESGQESIDNVTAFSSALTLAPNPNKSNTGSQNESQRYIAVWSSNDKGETPGFVVESKMLNRNAKFLDLNVALAKSDDDTHQAAVVIGTARIDITEQLLSKDHNRTIDLRVHKVLKEGPSSLSDGNRVVLLRTEGEGQKLCVEEVDESTSREDLTSAYTIDPSGDSMIRVQIDFEEVIGTSGLENNDRTADTERSEESSIPSASSSKEPERKELYSEPIDFPHNFVDDDGTYHTVAWKRKLLGKNEDPNGTDLPGYRLFGKRIDFHSCRRGIAQQIDDRIEDFSEHILSRTCAPTHRDDASLDRSLDRDDSFTLATNQTDSSRRHLFSLKELRSLAKDFSLSSGEYFFPEGVPETSQKGLEVDDEGYDSASLDSALSDRGQLLNKESWQKKRDKDDNTYSDGDEDTGASGDRSGSSGALNEENLDAVRFNFVSNRRVMSESNKFDIDSDNVRKNVYESRTYDSFPGEMAQLSDFDGDDEVSSLEGEKSLTDKVFAHKEASDLQRQTSGKPSLPSVVENIAEVLSIGGKACGYFTVDKVDNTNVIPAANWNQEIPTTVEQLDAQSVGELTAITLEKNEIQEANRKLLMKKLGLPKDILGWSAVGSNKANAGDGTENEEAQGQISGKPENYFSEYGEGTSGIRSMYESCELSNSNEKDNVEEA